jgi:CMP-N-acetylneuraminic acid synthetase
MFSENETGVMVPLFADEFYATSRRRQDMPTVFRPNGAVYVTWIEKFWESKDFYAPDVVGYKMPPERSVDIDTEEDFQAAERLMARRG